MYNENSTSYPMQNIMEPGDHDLLLGRGGETNHHRGNINFRKLVIQFKPRYRAASRADKPKVAAELVAYWRTLTPPGRFLKRINPGQVDSPWRDIGDMAAKRKTSKSLGERDYKTDDDEEEADGDESGGSRKRPARSDDSIELPSLLKSKPRHMHVLGNDGRFSSDINPFGSISGAPTDVPMERNALQMMEPSDFSGGSAGHSFSALSEISTASLPHSTWQSTGTGAPDVDPYNIPTAAALVRSVFGNNSSESSGGDSDDEEDGKMPAS